MVQATTTASGWLSSIDWNTFNNKQSALTFGSFTTTNPAITITNGTNSTVGPNVTLSIGNASASSTGLLTGTDWTTFNSKIGLSSLSAGGGISYNNTTGLFGDLFTFNNGLSRVGNTIGLTNGTDGQILTMNAGIPTWLALA